LDFREVAGISIRLRILKGSPHTLPAWKMRCCRDIDPVEDTERPHWCAHRSSLSRCCRDIDPVEDTESNSDRQSRKT